MLWLNEQGLDITCVRLRPYRLNDSVLVDVQQVVPLPEASEYTVQVRAKRQETRHREEQQRDFTKFVLTLGDEMHEPLNKRRTMLEVVRFLVGKGVSPEAILEAFPANARSRRFARLPGKVDSAAIPAAISEIERREGKRIDWTRYFHDQGEILYVGDETWLLTKMWGIKTQSCLEALFAAFAEHRISFDTVSE